MADPLLQPPVNPAAPPEKVAELVRSLARGIGNVVSLPGRAMQQGITTEEAIPWAAQTGLGMLGARAPFVKPGELGAVGGKPATLPSNYYELIPQEQRLSGKGISHPGYRWEVYDKTSGAPAGDPYSNKIRASRRVDKLDNAYGGYKYGTRPIQHGDLTPAEEAVLKDKGLYDSGGWAAIAKSLGGK